MHMFYFADAHIVLSLRPYTFLQFLSSQKTSTRAWNSLTLPSRCTWSCKAYVRLGLTESGLYLTSRLGLYNLAPMFWGTLSDRWGRRPIMFACLVTLSLSCVGLALVPTSAYWLLMLLRCFQATGSASTVALGM